MHTLRVVPESLSPEELDDYLARGWYRMGQSLFTCRFVILGDRLYSAVWVRLPLAGYTFPASLRRIMRRNGARFRVVHRPAIVDPEKEHLYQMHKVRFTGMKAPSLAASLCDESGHEVFATQEIAVYDGEHLVAFSFFDVGRDSIQSVCAMFHPDWARHSLGLWTMLLEIQHGIEREKAYFYPGYVLPGNPSFDYKLRTGACEYFAESSCRWRPHGELDVAALPAPRVARMLISASAGLSRAGIRHRRMIYPPYEISAFGLAVDRCLVHPTFIDCDPGPAGPSRLVLAYDLGREAFTLQHCVRIADLERYFTPVEGFERHPALCLDLLRAEHELAQAATPAEAVVAVRRCLGF